MLRLAFTLGDVAGIGPEVVARALLDPDVAALGQPVVFGHPDVLSRAMRLVGSRRDIQSISSCEQWQRSAGLRARTNLAEEESPGPVTCVVAGPANAAVVPSGHNDPRSGRAAYESLLAATRACLSGHVDAIVTAPLSKAALHMAGLKYPGHTEILAEQCGVREYGMMLYLPPGDVVRGPLGLGVVHVTLHTSLRSVFDLLSEASVREKITLIDQFMRDLTGQIPRIGVCALNPHAGEEGLFGDEESRIIAPAVAAARAAGLNVTGPFPADTLLKRAVGGEFDAAVAMYHDQGHIALKLVAFGRAVNVTLGLPIVRTSPSHGTAFDIAWQGLADPAGLIAATKVAAALAAGRHTRTQQ